MSRGSTFLWTLSSSLCVAPLGCRLLLYSWNLLDLCLIKHCSSLFQTRTEKRNFTKWIGSACCCNRMKSGLNPCKQMRRHLPSQRNPLPRGCYFSLPRCQQNSTFSVFTCLSLWPQQLRLTANVTICSPVAHFKQRSLLIISLYSGCICSCVLLKILNNLIDLRQI